jgi:hypothetical protein
VDLNIDSLGISVYNDILDHLPLTSFPGYEHNGFSITFFHNSISTYGDTETHESVGSHKTNRVNQTAHGHLRQGGLSKPGKQVGWTGWLVEGTILQGTPCLLVTTDQRSSPSNREAEKLQPGYGCCQHRLNKTVDGVPARVLLLLLSRGLGE